MSSKELDKTISKPNTPLEARVDEARLAPQIQAIQVQAIEGKPEQAEIALDEAMYEYRNHLVVAEQKAQEDYDKAVMSLSGGALGVSLVFLKDMVGPGDLLDETALFFAWISWGFSIASVLLSYFFSQKALRRAIEQVDAGQGREPSPGGIHASFTSFLNIAGGVLFLLGVILFVYFVWINLGALNVKK